MRFQILSDLHLEFHHEQGDLYGARCIDSLPITGDVLILAGDVGDYSTVRESLRLICKRFKRVLYVSGNHEYYGSDVINPYNNLRMQLDFLSNEISNLTILNRTLVEIEGIRISGCTLWFLDDPMNAVYKNEMHDFDYIRGFDPWVYQEAERDKRFLLDNATSEFPADVIITHYLPSYSLVSPQYKGSPINRFFVNPLFDKYSFLKPKLWVFGHTHDSEDCIIDGTRFVCNPKGYPHKLNPKYTPSLTVDIP